MSNEYREDCFKTLTEKIASAATLIYTTRAMNDINPKAGRIAFLDVVQFDDGSIRGGILVTDMETRPLEFRVTSPICPNLMQKILYGAALQDYVCGELIGQPLLKQLQERVNLVLVRDEALLNARTGSAIPMVRLSQNQQTIENADQRAVTIHPHREHLDDAARAEPFVAQITQRFNIFEPFERIRLALAEVHQKNLDQKRSRG